MSGQCKCCGRQQDLRLGVCFDCADSESVISDGTTMYDLETPKIDGFSFSMSKLYYILKKYVPVKSTNCLGNQFTSKGKAELVKDGIRLIAEERQRQIEVEGYSMQSDVRRYYNSQNLALAAVAYALPEELTTEWQRQNLIHRSNLFPWAKEYWKPTPENRIKELVKAGALIAAEIDRLQAIK